MKFKKIFVLLGLFIFSSFFVPSFVLAQANPQTSETYTSVADATRNQTVSFMHTSGLQSATRADNIVGSIIKTVLSLLGIVFLILIIFSGYQWMTAGGNEEQVSKAKDRIRNAVIGVVIVVLAYAITAFVFKNLPGGSSGTTPGGTTGTKTN